MWTARLRETSRCEAPRHRRDCSNHGDRRALACGSQEPFSRELAVSWRGVNGVSVLAPPAPWRVLLVLATGWLSVVNAEVSGYRQALRESLPKYDSAIREQALAEETAAKVSADPEAQRRSAPTTEDPAAGGATQSEGSIKLPEVIVEARRFKVRPLPRMHRPLPPGSVNIEPFASPSERDRLLVKKHFTALDQAMNKVHLPLVGVPLAARAREAEARLQYAGQLDQLAAMMIHPFAAGASRGPSGRVMQKMH